MPPFPFRVRAAGAATALALAAACWPAAAAAALSFDEALSLARDQAPSLAAQHSALASAQAEQPAATTLPDPRLTLGVDNLPLTGADRYSLTRDFMTMQRIGLMQEVPNRAKRDARAAGAQARIERERAMLAVARLAVQREAALAWIGVHYAERRVAQLADLARENQIVIDTTDARIASGKAMPAERTMARQEALALADRHDDALRDVARQRAALRRWVGPRGDEPLDGAPPPTHVHPDGVRAGLHRHAEVAPYTAMQAMAQAQVGEAEAEQRGDWAWEVVYSRRGPQYPDMLSLQVSIDLPWQKDRRQQPMVSARQKELQRIEAEREETLRKHQEEVEAQLAELQALDTQRERLERSGQPLADERVALALAGYQSGRGDLGAVLMARRELVETRLRLIDLDTQRAALRVRLTTLIAEQ
ncbi:TolC family protein [Ideonella sp. A 288]|uniref:TolC family protein n=1 Tax=Ideonella sp. A 288 TaxID=1962181 RepID=UPI000B4AA660|nr:TolC family protein [Ideonella sp. A 288]